MKTTLKQIAMKTIRLAATNAQKQCIHRLKRQFGINEEDYRGLICQYSDGRTTTSSELYKHEATALIRALLDPDGKKQGENREKEKTVKAIYGISMDIGFLNKDYQSNNPEEVEMNKAKITSFLRTHGVCKKPISRQNLDELRETLKQLRAIKRKEENNNGKNEV